MSEMCSLGKPLMTAAARAIRNIALALAFAVAAAASTAGPSLAQEQASPPAATGMMVITTVKAGVKREQVMAVMPAEIRATVRLYLNGKIREWYSRGDGRGVIFLLDTGDAAEARTIMEDLPLGKENLMDHEYIAVGPLAPLGLLMANPKSQQ